MSAYFIVRAQVVDGAVKDVFDRWYQDEHLPDAHEAFVAWLKRSGCERALRGIRVRYV